MMAKEGKVSERSSPSFLACPHIFWKPIHSRTNTYYTALFITLPKWTQVVSKENEVKNEIGSSACGKDDCTKQSNKKR